MILFVARSEMRGVEGSHFVVFGIDEEGSSSLRGGIREITRLEVTRLEGLPDLENRETTRLPDYQIRDTTR